MAFNILGGKIAFLNFDHRLLSAGMHLSLPRKVIVIEILETVEPTADLIALCRGIHEQGYSMALDDFVSQPEFEPLTRIADLMKIDMWATTKKEQNRLLQTYGPLGVMKSDRNTAGGIIFSPLSHDEYNASSNTRMAMVKLGDNGSPGPRKEVPSEVSRTFYRTAQHRLPVRRIAAPQVAEVLHELSGRADERRLRRRRRGTAETAVLIQRGQQRQPYADTRRGARNRHIGVEWRVRAAPEPVQIKKFCNAGVSAAQQIQITARRDCLQIVVADLRRGGIHRLAPAPEIIAGGAGALRPGRQHALERVAVRIGKTWQGQSGNIGR